MGPQHAPDGQACRACRVLLLPHRVLRGAAQGRLGLSSAVRGRSRNLAGVKGAVAHQWVLCCTPYSSDAMHQHYMMPEASLMSQP